VAVLVISISTLGAGCSSEPTQDESSIRIGIITSLTGAEARFGQAQKYGYEMAIDVPRFEEDKLSASSLILADLMERVPMRNTGAGQFVIGDMKVRPRLSDTFRSDEKLGIYVQLYHFSPDAKTHKADGAMEYQITRNETEAVVLSYSEDAGALEGSASQVTVEKWLPLRDLAPGLYTLRVRAVDRNRGQTLSSSAGFTVVP